MILKVDLLGNVPSKAKVEESCEDSEFFPQVRVYISVDFELLIFILQEITYSELIFYNFAANSARR